MKIVPGVKLQDERSVSEEVYDAGVIRWICIIDEGENEVDRERQVY